MQPYYTSDNVKAAFRLRYAWTGWPSQPPLPPEPDNQFFAELATTWESDSIRLLEHKWCDDDVKILASVTPQVSPVHFSARIKGRLQHHLRLDDCPTKFSRKFSMRTLGENCQETVESYVANQVRSASFADPRHAAFLNQFTVVNEDVDLSSPFATGKGRYWYLLHLVLVVRKREPILDEDWLRTLRDGCFRIARAKKHRISTTSVMPDHLHFALAGHVDCGSES